MINAHMVKRGVVGAILITGIAAASLYACNPSSDQVNDQAPDQPPEEESTENQVVARNLRVPWTIVMGPDNYIWLTERGGVVKRFDPSAPGNVETVGTIDAVFERSESGLMGLAFHPDWPGQPYIYLTYSFAGDGRNIYNRLVRARIDKRSTGTAAGYSLGAMETLIDSIPGGSIHNGSRILIGPEDRFLYVTTGDAGRQELSQDTTSLAGKILRLTLDGQPAPGNRYGRGIYTIGHRNPQGIAFHPKSGVLYSSEHGPGTDDEINVIESGRNYGWPSVHGFCDNNIGSGERSFCDTHNVREPITVWTPTVAPGGIAFKGDVLYMTTLKDQTLYQLTISDPSAARVNARTVFSKNYGRIRDVLVTADGRVFVATSNRDGRGQPDKEDDRVVMIR